MKNIKTTYNHVGRPTNEEVKNQKKKKYLKIIGIITILLMATGGIFIFLNKDNLSLESIMGNSATNSTMLKVQNSSKYDEIKFIPTLKQSTTYYLTSKKDINNNLLEQLDYDRSKLKFYKLQIYKDGKLLKTLDSNTKKLGFSYEYIGQTLAIKLYLKNMETNKLKTKYLKILITNYIYEEQVKAVDNELLKINKNKIIKELKTINELESIEAEQITNKPESIIKEKINVLTDITNNCKIKSADMRWPVYGGILTFPKITVNYGNIIVNNKKTTHYGIDISNEKINGIDNYVAAIYSGKVVKVVNTKKNTTNKNSENYGTYIVLEHSYKGEKLYSIYANLKYNSIPKNIKVGTKVLAGDKLGNLGNTDMHFEMRKNDIKSSTRKKNNVNPLKYISNEIKWKCN